MSINAAALRELHRIHQQLSDLRDRVERGPKQMRAREANVAQLKGKLDEAKGRVQETQMAINRKQLDLKAGEQKIVDLKLKLNLANSNKEYQSFMEQIAAAEMTNSVMADEILEAMEKADGLAGSVKEAEQQLAAGQQEYDKTKRGIDESAASLRADITRLEASLVQAEAALPGDFKADYNRIVHGKGAKAMASVEDGVC